MFQVWPFPRVRCGENHEWYNSDTGLRAPRGSWLREAMSASRVAHGSWIRVPVGIRRFFGWTHALIAWNIRTERPVERPCWGGIHELKHGRTPYHSPDSELPPRAPPN